MRIPVIYCDGNYGNVDPERLDALIESRGITAFKRESGWVKVPQGPLRGKGGSKYAGPERRKPEE